MPQQLAEDEITITIGHEVIYLRPSLRAALRLERQFGGFDKIIAGILAGNVTLLATILRESATYNSGIPDLIEEIGLKPLHIGLGVLTGPLLAHVYRLAGIDLTTPQTTQDTAPGRIEWAEHHERLFSIATGWLGWTPSQAYEATPNEIMCAYRGKVEMLRAIYGSAEDKTDTSAMSLDDKFKTALSAYPTKVVTRSSKGRAA
jgi:hypothetical protein